MTRLGDPMLDPGGEMEVSDVRLCCGRDKDRRGEELTPTWWERGETGYKNPALQGTLAILLKVLSGYFILSLYCLLNQCLSVNEIRNAQDFRLLD